MGGKIVTVIDTSNYQESYSEPVPFEAEVVDKYDINTVVVSQNTGKRYELYEHQIAAFEEAFFNRQKDLDDDIAEFIDKNYSKLFLDEL